MTNCSSRKKFFQILKGLLVKWCGKRDLNSHVLGHQLLRLGCLPFHHFRISKCREIFFTRTIFSIPKITNGVIFFIYQSQNSNTAYEVYFAFYLFRQVINRKLHIIGDTTQLEIPEPMPVVV